MSLLGNLPYTLCAGGFQPGATPPECVLEVNMGQALLNLERDGGFAIATGTVLMRVQRMPFIVSGSFGGTALGFTGSATCAGSVPGMVAPLPVPVRFAFRVDEGDGGLATLDPVDSVSMVLNGATSFCSNSAYTSYVQPQVRDFLGTAVGSAADLNVKPAIEASLLAQLCLRPGDGGVCAFGTRGDGGVCVNGMGRCYSGLHFKAAIPTIPACLQ